MAVLGLVLALFGAACSSGSADTAAPAPDPTSESTTTPAPTSAPAATADPTPEPSEPAGDQDDGPESDQDDTSAAETAPDQPAALAGDDIERVGRPIATNPMGTKFEWAPRQLEVDDPYLDSLGSKYGFYEISWCRLEPEEGQLDWTRLDQIVERADVRDMDLMIKIRVGSCWATGGAVGEDRGERDRRPSAMPSDMEAYHDFVTSLVSRYLDTTVTTYAIENEVNGPNFWGASVEDFVTLSEAGAVAVREADPEAIVIDSGLSSTAYGVAIAADLLERGEDERAVEVYTDYYLRRTRRRRDFPPVANADELRIVLENGQPARNIAYAQASTDMASRGIVDKYQLHFYERYDSIPELMAYLERVIGDVPIEVTEAGIFWLEGQTDASPQILEAETALLVANLFQLGADSMTFLPLRQREPSEEIRWGLLNADGTVRPSGEAFALIAQATNGPNPRTVNVETADGTAVIIGSDEAAVAVIDRGTPDSPAIEMITGESPELLVEELSP